MENKYKITDRIIIYLVIALVLLPHYIINIPFFGDINAKAIITLILTLALIFQIIIKSFKISLLTTLLIIGFPLTAILSIMLGREYEDVSKQVFLYFPFISACLILNLGINIKYEKFEKFLVYAITCSSLLAAYIFYFNPTMIADRTLLVTSLDWGRLYWPNGANAIIPLVIALFLHENRKKHYIIIASISPIISLLTFNRTFLLAAIGIVICSIFYQILNRRIHKSIFIYLKIALLLFLAFYTFDFENVRNLLQYRVIDFLSASADNSDHINDRYILYSQYYDVYKTSPIVGVGFGIPFATYPKISFYTDVTLVAFILPLGFFGLIILATYIIILWKKLKSPLTKQNKSEKTKIFAMKLIFLFSLFISFNENIIVYKEFIIIFTILVLSSTASSKTSVNSSAKYNFF